MHAASMLRIALCAVVVGAASASQEVPCCEEGAYNRAPYVVDPVLESTEPLARARQIVTHGSGWGPAPFSFVDAQGYSIDIEGAGQQIHRNISFQVDGDMNVNVHNQSESVVRDMEWAASLRNAGINNQDRFLLGLPPQPPKGYDAPLAATPSEGSTRSNTKFLQQRSDHA